MTASIVRPKTISQAQMTGEQGVAIVKERVHAMGYLFTTYGPVEAGIDGLIEFRNPVTGQVGGQLVAVQIKTKDSRAYTAETEHDFEYLCQPEDLGYWQQANVPVIVVLARLSDRSIYWKPVPAFGSPHDPEVRRLRIDKSADRFDVSAADAIAQIAVDQAKPGVWLPASRQADELWLTAVKAIFPSTIRIATTTYRHGPDALKALLEITDSPPFEWAARGSRLITFLDIETSLLRHIIEPGSIVTFPVEEIAFHDNKDEQHFFVDLLNRTLRAQLDPMLVWSRSLKLYYFPAMNPVIDRDYRYLSLKNETTRAVVKAKRRPDQSVAYVRHSAFRARFWREFDDWYLTITPDYVFTHDGVRRDRFAGERKSKLKRLENNASIRGQFLMWQSLLTNIGHVPDQLDMLSAPPETPLLRFEPLDIIGLPVSVPDDIWCSRDAHTPNDDEEDLPL